MPLLGHLKGLWAGQQGCGRGWSLQSSSWDTGSAANKSGREVGLLAIPLLREATDLLRGPEAVSPAS